MTNKKASIPKAKKVELTQGPVVLKEELAQMLRQEMDKQIKACRQELDEANKKILDKYQCDLEISVMVTSRGNFPNIAVVPRPPQK